MFVCFCGGFFFLSWFALIRNYSAYKVLNPCLDNFNYDAIMKNLLLGITVFKSVGYFQHSMDSTVQEVMDS